MSQTFKGNEIINLAIEIEKNGYMLYKSVAGKAKSVKVRKVFLWLAAEENKHRKLFKAILEGTDWHPQPESYTGEYNDYVKAVADGNIFTKGKTVKNIIKQSPSILQALKTAIGFEKASVEFYSRMKKFVPESGQVIIRSVIEEEKQHIVRILELKNKLNKKELDIVIFPQSHFSV